MRCKPYFNMQINYFNKVDWTIYYYIGTLNPFTNRNPLSSLCLSLSLYISFSFFLSPLGEVNEMI